MVDVLTGALWGVASVIVIGLPILFVWGAVRNRRALLALRERARARGYHAESASSYRGQDGPVAWAAQTRYHDPLGSGSSESTGYLPSAWHFAARWMPVERLLDEAVQHLKSATARAAPVLETGGVWLRLQEPARGDGGPWRQAAVAGACWWRQEGPDRLTAEALRPVVDWMHEQGVGEVSLRWTSHTLEVWGFPAPDDPEEAQWARFIEVARALALHVAPAP